MFDCTSGNLRYFGMFLGICDVGFGI